MALETAPVFSLVKPSQMVENLVALLTEFV
jgi:hypothetical protein